MSDLWATVYNRACGNAAPLLHLDRQLPQVKGFLDMTVTYIVSREWQDLLSTYLFHLHPLPHCQPSVVGYSIFGLSFTPHAVEIGPDCSKEADAAVQAYFAVALLAVSALVQGLLLKCMRTHVADQLTSIVGMCVGWGAGDAVIKWLVEIQHASEVSEALPPAAQVQQPPPVDPERRQLIELEQSIILGSSMSVGRVLFASSYTLAAALLIVLMHPLTTATVRCSERPCIEVLEEVFFSLWRLGTRALTTSVLMLWAYVSSRNLLEGLSVAQQGTALHWRLLVLWASFLTFGGAALTLQLLRWRDALASGGATLGDADGWLRASVSQVLLLIERVLSWLAGCAWTDVCFAKSSTPSIDGALDHVGVALGLTLASLGWIVLVGGGHGIHHKSEREHAESYFVSSNLLNHARARFAQQQKGRRRPLNPSAPGDA
eukprot:6347274-Prymnesium_polylepis.2